MTDINLLLILIRKTAALVRRALAKVCTVPVLLVDNRFVFFSRNHMNTRNKTAICFPRSACAPCYTLVPVLHAVVKLLNQRALPGCPCSLVVKPLWRHVQYSVTFAVAEDRFEPRPACVRLLKKELFQIIPMHMMTREIIPGRKQRARRCPL